MSNLYDFNKWMLLAFAGLLVLAARGIVYWSPIARALLLMTAATLLSTLIVSTNKIEASTNVVGFITYASFFLLVSIMPASEIRTKKLLLNLLLFTSLILSIIAIFQFKNSANTFWTPIGSSVRLVAFLSMMVPLCIGAWIRRKSVATGLIMALVAAGLSLAVRQIIHSPPPIIPQQVGFHTMLENSKNPLRFLFGVGPENFLPAFTASRPESLNYTFRWNYRYPGNASFVLHSGTILGMSGLIAALLFIIAIGEIIIKTARSGKQYDLAAALIAGIVILFVVPPSIPILATIISLVLLANTKEKTLSFSLPGSIRILIAFIGLFFWTNIFYAKISFDHSLTAVLRKDYHQAILDASVAVRHNPFSPRYHIMLSQAIASRIKEKPELLFNLQNTFIIETNAAIAMAPNSVISWENSARAYRELIGIMKDADALSVSAFLHAIALDPTNPMLRVELGNMYRKINNIDKANFYYQSAVALKNDLVLPP